VRSGNEWVLKKDSWLLQAKTESVAKDRAHHTHLIEGDVTVGETFLSHHPIRPECSLTATQLTHVRSGETKNGRTLGDYIENGEI
jgi:hypothetical protein